MSKLTKKNILDFLKSKKLGFILAAIQLFCSVFFMVLLLYLNMLPMKYFVPASAAMFVMIAYVVVTQFSKKFRLLGKLISIIFTVLFIVASVMVNRANTVLNSITGANQKTDVVSVFVLAKDTAESVSDVISDDCGILKVLDREKTNQTIQHLEDDAGAKLKLKEFDDIQSLTEALYAGNVRYIIINEAFISMIEDIQYGEDSFPYQFFRTETKKLSSKKIVTVIENNTPEVEKNITSEPFIVYFSGIDVTGPISTTSRSDVNILAVVNPATYQILLLSTPRDYYVPTTVSGGVRDKLTHAGNYGVDCSMGTLGMLYDINIDYYFRVNFTGFVDVIDALGGITIYSDYDFYTLHEGAHIVKGENQLSGKEALGFARERYAFSDGDRQRGRNHMTVITAVIKKLASPAILNNYSSLMSSLEGSFEVSLSADDISALVKYQLDKMPNWNIQTYSVSGPGDRQTTFSAPSFSAFVMQPDTAYVANAKTLIQQVLTGQTIDFSNLLQTSEY